MQALEKTIDEVDKVNEKYESISEEVSNHIETNNKTRTVIEDYLKQITTLESTLQYIKIIVAIDNLK